MTRKQRILLITALVFLLYSALVVGAGFLLPFNGARFTIFVCTLLVLGLAAAVGIAVFKIRSGTDVQAASPGEAGNLDTLLRGAGTRLRSERSGARLNDLPLIYLLGEENSGKTQIVVQSGLDADLLAGEVFRDGLVTPTRLANVWYTRSATLVEAGGALLQQPALWTRLVTLTGPSQFRAMFRARATQPSRLALVSVSVERLLSATPEQLRAQGQTLNERLRTLSKSLGINLPVYILFTKLDAMPSFADYMANLTDSEVREPLGTLLTPLGTAGAGLYAESAAREIGQRLDELSYSLAEFRLEVLSRPADAAAHARAYEFPRDLRKLRTALVDLLVEIGRPSQLGVNPFLRGFYFTGLRARIVEDTIAGVPLATPSPTAAADGATRIFSFQPGGAMPLPLSAAQPQTRSRRVPQWVFLPELFPKILFADRGALESSQLSTRIGVAKRILAGTAAALLLGYLVALGVSYANNRALEQRLQTAATKAAPHTEPASVEELQNLEELRAIYEQVDGYQRHGAPLRYRWGLYPGDRLRATACTAFGGHFRTLLLQPTQNRILERLAALPAAPKPTDDYAATYQPFRAYLVTTANPEKSTEDPEAGSLLAAWQGDAGTRAIPQQSADLARLQFQTYAAHLAEPGSCLAHLGGPAQAPAVRQARAYLGQFQGIEQVYLSMKAAADRKHPSLRFNDVYPATKPFVVDPYEVEGAFTKGGYGFMQDAMAHPEPYTSGEPWVLGPQTGPPLDRAALDRELPNRYRADFLAAWRAYLKAGHVVPAESFAAAKDKLHQLDSPSSALLQLLQLLSQNTAVGNPAFSQPFQAPQSVVPPTAAALPVGIPYIASLQALEGAINSMLLVPNSQNDPNAVAPVIQAASAAEGAVNTLRGGFTPPDPVGGMDTTTEALLLAPIRSVTELAKAAPAKAAGGGAAAFCASIAPVLGKFPFNPESKADATLPEIAAVFGPGQAVAQYAQASKMVQLTGSLYMPLPGAPLTPSPAFLHFLNAAQQVTNTFFPAGGAPPTLTFTLTEEAVPNLPPATLEIDKESLTTSGSSKTFTWVSSPTGTVRLTAAAGNSIPASGPWALFHFAYNAKHPAPGRLQEVFEVNGHPMTSASGVPLDYRFDVTGPGAPFLNPTYLRTQLRCVTKVAQ